MSEEQPITHRVWMGGVGWDQRPTDFVGTKQECERRADVLNEQWRQSSTLPPEHVAMPIDWSPDESFDASLVEPSAQQVPNLPKTPRSRTVHDERNMPKVSGSKGLAERTPAEWAVEIARQSRERQLRYYGGARELLDHLLADLTVLTDNLLAAADPHGPGKPKGGS